MRHTHLLGEYFRCYSLPKMKVILICYLPLNNSYTFMSDNKYFPKTLNVIYDKRSYVGLYDNL